MRLIKKFMLSAAAIALCLGANYSAALVCGSSDTPPTSSNVISIVCPVGILSIDDLPLSSTEHITGVTSSSIHGGPLLIITNTSKKLVVWCVGERDNKGVWGLSRQPTPGHPIVGWCDRRQ